MIYDKPVLLWWGLSLFLCKLGSRRQRDSQFNSDGPEVLATLHRLAGTQQTTRPVHQTLDSFVGRIGSAAIAGLSPKMVHRLIRMKALDEARLQGRGLVLIDGSGYLTFHHRHCAPCLTRQHGDQTVDMHQVLEAKLLGPGGTVFSLATEFIANRDAQDTPTGASPERLKQDCELKALPRLVTTIRAAFPQLRICLGGDRPFACGTGFQVAQDHHCDYLYVFQEGRTPALWRDFQGLLELGPDPRVERTTPQQTHQVYRWVNNLDYEDSERRQWQFHARHGRDTQKHGTVTAWAWVTPLAVDRDTVVEVATSGGRHRWREENEGLNTQKTRGLNLEHAYRPTCWAAYDFLLQIAHMILQLVAKGSLLRQLAEPLGKTTAVGLFGR